MLVYSNTKEPWKGERIDDISHPRNIEKLWSKAELTSIGLEIFVPTPPPTPKPVDPLTTALTPVQFDAMLRLSGKYEAITAAVEALPEPSKSVALAKINRSTEYHREDPLFAQMGAAAGLSSATIDALWLQALEIK